MEIRRKSIGKNRGARLRARLVLRGISVRAWAREHGYPLSTVYAAIHGRRQGPRSRDILQSLDRLLKK